jgi:hypothetical protein
MKEELRFFGDMIDRSQPRSGKRGPDQKIGNGGQTPPTAVNTITRGLLRTPRS